MRSEWIQFLGGISGSLFVIAGLAKLTANASVTRFLVALGLSQRFAEAANRVVMPVEILLGAALLAAPSSVTAIAALALALTFFGLQLRALTSGVDAPCQCFGSISLGGMPYGDLIRATVVVCACGSLTTVSFIAAAPFAAASVAVTGATVQGAATALAVVAALAIIEQTWVFEQRRPRVITLPRRAAGKTGGP